MKVDALDLHGQAVNSFSMDVPNLGRIGELSRAIVTMLDSEHWRDYRDGLGEFHFLPVEFDYFLALHHVHADDMPRLAITPDERMRLAAAMDPSKNGLYRRGIADFDAAHPRAGLAKHWTAAKWGAVKYPLGVRAARKAQCDGVTKETQAVQARTARLQTVKGWQSRVRAIVASCDGLTRDEVLAVVEALKVKTRAMKRRLPEKERKAATRQKLKMSPRSSTMGTQRRRGAA